MALPDDRTPLFTPARPFSPGGSDLSTRLYQELRSLAGARAHRGGGPPTLQPTALVHEAWMRLAERGEEFRSRGHFLATAAMAMRCVVADHARAARALRRGGDRRREPLSEVVVATADSTVDLIVLHETLERLEARDPRKAEVVTLRFLLGCSIEETADTLRLSPATVKREWTFARAWLYRELEASGLG